MLKLRKRLAQYQEQFYLVFVLSIVALFSAGFNSTDRVYQVVFCAATLFLLLKLAVTDYTWRELLWMAVITLLLGLTLLRNGEKTLIITAMAVFGAKNVSLDRVFRNSLWVKAMFTVGTILLAATGIIENQARSLPKNGEHITVYCYGYHHPNAAFANVFFIFVIAILVWKDKLKWYAYVGFTLVLWGAYWLFVCRTGLVVWAALLMLVLGYKVSCKLKWEKIYLALLLLIPVVLAVLTFVLPLVGMENSVVAKLDFYLTGRIKLLIQGINNIGFPLLGNISRNAYDSIYFHLVYNYGWLTAIICFPAYLYTMWECKKNDRPYEVIALSIMALYGFMEHWPLSIGWNISILCMARILFRKRT